MRMGKLNIKQEHLKFDKISLIKIINPIGLLASAVLTATISGLADKIIAGRKCNAFVLSDLPTGKYSDLYEKDAKNPAGKRFVKATVK